MYHLPQLIHDLGILLIVAALVALICKRIKLPVILGYLVAGFLLGPHVSVIPTVIETETIKIWADIGVIFLLFSLGLEFSFRKLTQVGFSALVTAAIEVSIMFFLGYFTGKALGWSNINSLFLGALISISSTTIIVKAIQELGFKGRRFVDLVYGVLVFEDIVAVLLLVILSTISISKNFSSMKLLYSGIQLGFFLVLWFSLGLFFVPKFLKKIKNLLNEETRLILSLGLCLLMVLVVTHFGFSPALGAFVMGSIIAETDEGMLIEKVVHPVRDLFAAIFFVSVGMLIQPGLLVEHWPIILFITMVTIFGKIFGVTLGALVAGQPLNASIQAGFSLAQIGEFSFIIATLAKSLDITNDLLYVVAVTVSAVTTLTTPFFMSRSFNFSQMIEKKFPEKLLLKLEKYRGGLGYSGRRSLPKLLWDAFGLKMMINATLIVAGYLMVPEFLMTLLLKPDANPIWGFCLSAIVSAMICSPFFAGFVAGPPRNSIWRNPEEIQRLQTLDPGIKGIRLGMAFIGMAVVTYHTVKGTGLTFFVFGISLVLNVILWPLSSRFYLWIEKKFFENMGRTNLKTHLKHEKFGQLVPWDANLVELVVSANSDLIAKSLLEAKLKEKFKVTVAVLERGTHIITAPGPNELLLPADRIFVVGEEENIIQLKNVIEKDGEIPIPPMHFGLEALLISETSTLVNKKIRDCGLRESIQGLIVGVERSGIRILNPEPSFEIKPKDLLWVVGNKELIKELEL